MATRQSFVLTLWQKSRWRILLIGLLFIMVLGFYGYERVVIEPRVQLLSTEQFRLQQKVRQRQADSANRGLPVSIAEQIEKNLHLFNDLVPPQEQFSGLLGDLFSWAQEAGLKIDQINYQPEQGETTEFLRYGLNFSVEGGYTQIKKFIYLLEKSERILIIDNISLSSQAGRGERKSEVNLRIALTTYFQGGAE